ncbi:MAG: BamA/TamA family outer membrane protein, partial [bacterium]|nr:BamA/TamA family outer membrane protein [bacterium]
MTLRIWVSLFLLFPALLRAEDSVIVSAIRIEGALRTREWVIRRELRFNVGDTLAQTDLASAENRLHNLIFLNSVHVTADSAGAVTVDLRETWPILPVGSVEFNEGTFSEVASDPSTFFDKATLYAGLAHFNFRGAGDRLLLFGQFGASDGFSLYYDSRWLAPRLPIAVRVRWNNLRISDREWAVHDTTAYMRSQQHELDVSTRAGAPRRLGLTAAYWRIRKEHPGGTQRKASATVWLSPYVVLDHRDVEWYPTRGTYVRATTNWAGGDEQFLRSQFELRGYLPLRDAPRAPTLALRFHAATATSSTPGWAGYFTGFGTVLRGYTGVKTLSKDYLLGDVELRFPITRETTYDVPLLGRYGQRWPFGIYGMLFAQRAELQYNGLRDERAAAGGGLFFRVPYVQIVEATAA